MLIGLGKSCDFSKPGLPLLYKGIRNTCPDHPIGLWEEQLLVKHLACELSFPIFTALAQSNYKVDGTEALAHFLDEETKSSQ